MIREREMVMRERMGEGNAYTYYLLMVVMVVVES